MSVVEGRTSEVLEPVIVVILRGQQRNIKLRFILMCFQQQKDQKDLPEMYPIRSETRRQSAWLWNGPMEDRLVVNPAGLWKKLWADRVNNTSEELTVITLNWSMKECWRPGRAMCAQMFRSLFWHDLGPEFKLKKCLNSHKNSKSKCKRDYRDYSVKNEVENE